MLLKFTLFAVVLALTIGTSQAALFGIGFTQSAGVEGNLVCDGKPVQGALVKLYDEDDFGIDDLLAEARTDSDGHFRISGHTSEITPIDPKFNIYHHCGDTIIPRCARKHSVKIPDSYITKGETPKKFYNAQTIELAGTPKGENRDCFH